MLETDWRETKISRDEDSEPVDAAFCISNHQLEKLGIDPETTNQ